MSLQLRSLWLFVKGESDISESFPATYLFPCLLSWVTACYLSRIPLCSLPKMDEAKEGEREGQIAGRQAGRQGHGGSMRGRGRKTQPGNWATGLRRDTEVRAYRRERGNPWRKQTEEEEEAVKCIDFLPPSPSFLKLIKVLACFSDYPTAYRGFLLLKGSMHYLLLLLLLLSFYLSSPLPFRPPDACPTIMYIAGGALAWNYNKEAAG